jgi:hypothetical protein
LRKRKIEFESDDELAARSLKNYAAKLEIQNKYPEADETLTEYEKDLALRRYLIKNERYYDNYVNHEIKTHIRADVIDNPVDKKKDIIPYIEPKKSHFVSNYLILLVFSILASILTLAYGSASLGMILLAFTVAIFGCVLAFNYEKFLPKKTEVNYQGENQND